MPTGGFVTIIGAKETEEFFRKAARVAPEAAKRGLRIGALRVEASAKKGAPVAKGALRASIHTTFEEGGFRARIGPSVIYGRIRELGGVIVPKVKKWLRFRTKAGKWVTTKRVVQKGKPYMGPALLQNVDAIVRDITNEIWKAVRG